MSTTPDLDYTPTVGVSDDVDDLDALLDVDQGDGDPEPEDDDVDEPEQTTDGPARAGGRSRSTSNRALIRRVTNKAGELLDAPAERRATLARLLGSDTGVADLTYAVMTADRSAMAPVTDLTAIAEADQFAAGIVATAMGRTRMKAVWALLITLGADIPASVPASDAKAAMALAPAVHKLPQSVRDELAEVVALARKS